MARRSKVCSLEEAGALVASGASLLVAGAHFNNVPTALVRQLIRQGTRDLELIPTPSAGLWVDMLVAAGAVRKIHVSYVGLEFLGLAPNFGGPPRRGSSRSARRTSRPSSTACGRQGADCHSSPCRPSIC